MLTSRLLLVAPGSELDIFVNRLATHWALVRATADPALYAFCVEVVSLVAIQLRYGIGGAVGGHANYALVLLTYCSEELLGELCTWNGGQNLICLSSLFSSAGKSSYIEPSNEYNDHCVNDEEEVTKDNEHQNHEVEARVSLGLAFNNLRISALSIVQDVTIDLPG